MHVTALSDLHGNLIPIEPCDLLLIAGDICPVRDHSLQSQAAFLNGPLRKWLAEIPARHIVAIAGNHDFLFEQDPDMVPRDLRWIYLQDSATEINGLSVYGTPWQPRFFDWAFNLDEPELARKWEMIPAGTDILVCHSPPRGFGDRTVRGDHAGSPSLLQAIRRVRPKLAVFGHIHEGRGRWTIDVDGQTVQLANATLVDERYRLAHAPMRFEIS
ncbi:MAG: Calcineurin-like phosphoesterase [Phycisphaerales bacterium]|nr:Calcineurin-like phosphoesterase [Phycisphaerales bacterium]MDB5353703.1 Calcineurin-like phosphoesterase [Phycisphaerales bacterium]